jgi:DNA-binding transcriptional LysR family regulator
MDWVSIARRYSRHRRLLWRTCCEYAAEFEDFLKSRKPHKAISHKVDCENDTLALLEANLGIGVLPSSAPRSEDIKLIAINGLELRRTVCLYGVAGRQRSPATTALIKLTRATEWSI